MNYASIESYSEFFDDPDFLSGNPFMLLKSKASWAGPEAANAFKSMVDHFEKIEGRRLFMKNARKAQRAAAALAQPNSPNANSEFTAKIQMAPACTNYPALWAAVLSCYALTAILEYKSRMKTLFLSAELGADYLKDPAAADGMTGENIDAGKYKALAEIIVKSIENRMLCEEINICGGELSAPVEFYRLFLASQAGPSLYTFSDIVDSVILFGDLLPGYDELDVHFETRDVMKYMHAVCRPFFQVLSSRKRPGAEKIAAFSTLWAKTIIPLAGVRYARKDENGRGDAAAGAAGISGSGKLDGKGAAARGVKNRIAPLAGKRRPELAAGGRPGMRPVKSAFSEEEMKKINDLANASEEAAGQKPGGSGDIRYDVLEAMMRGRGFEESPVQSAFAEGNTVRMELGGKEVEGEVFDGPVEISDDDAAAAELAEKALPYSEMMSALKYPEMTGCLEKIAMRSSGLVDPLKLPLCRVSRSIFARYENYRAPKAAGRPLIIVAFDASGSLGWLIEPVKVLAAAFIQAIKGGSARLISCYYHSDKVPGGGAAEMPAVKWITGHGKSLDRNLDESIKALCSVKSASGAQSDALSLKHILESSIRSASSAGLINNAYYIILSDCAWNRSFRAPSTAGGREEVLEFFRWAGKTYKNMLHTTLVCVGAGDSGPEFGETVDKVINISSEEIKNNEMVEKIGLYVNELVLERRRASEKKAGGGANGNNKTGRRN